MSLESLSARRAWIEMGNIRGLLKKRLVALRKESVDRNTGNWSQAWEGIKSLSARRAWIEISARPNGSLCGGSRSPQGERG